MSELTKCQSPSSTLTWQKQHLGKVNLTMVGILKEKHDDVLEFEYLGSNKFWDESDIFPIYNENVLVYRLQGDESLDIGEKVEAQVTDIYWDTKHERLIEPQKCAWTMRVLSANRIEPYSFNVKIESIEFLQRHLLLFFLFTTVVVALCIYVSLTKRLHRPLIPAN